MSVAMAQKYFSREALESSVEEAPGAWRSWDPKTAVRMALSLVDRWLAFSRLPKSSEARSMYSRLMTAMGRSAIASPAATMEPCAVFSSTKAGVGGHAQTTWGTDWGCRRPHEGRAAHRGSSAEHVELVPRADATAPLELLEHFQRNDALGAATVDAQKPTRWAGQSSTAGAYARQAGGLVCTGLLIHPSACLLPGRPSHRWEVVDAVGLTDGVMGWVDATSSNSTASSSHSTSSSYGTLPSDPM